MQNPFLSVIWLQEKLKESYHYSCNVKILQQTLLLFAVAVLVYALYKRLLTILSPTRKLRPYPQIIGEPKIENHTITVVFKSPKSFQLNGSLHRSDGTWMQSMQVIDKPDGVTLMADISAIADKPFTLEVVGEGFRFVRSFK